MKNPFILTSTHFGMMLANRLDYYKDPLTGGGFCGVGCDLMEWGEYRREEVDRCFAYILQACRRGSPVVVLDIGANIGTHTIPWAKQMALSGDGVPWGEVIAIEPQERIYYALAGNITLNNCFNARALWGAAAAKSGQLTIPVVDHCQPANFGGLSLTSAPKHDSPKPIGETVVPAIAIDDMQIPRVDFMKIDVEGMELDVLQGASKTIARCRPVIVVEANFTVSDFKSICPGYRATKFDDLNIILEPELMYAETAA